MDTKGSLNYDLDSSAGIVAILAAIRNSNLSSAEKNSLRDLIFSFTNGGRDEVVRNALENKLNVYKIVVPKSRKGSNNKNKLGFGSVRPTPTSFSVKKKYKEVQIKKLEELQNKSESTNEGLKFESNDVSIKKDAEVQSKKKEQENLRKVDSNKEEATKKVEEEKKLVGVVENRKKEFAQKDELESDDEIQKAILAAEAEMMRLKSLREKRQRERGEEMERGKRGEEEKANKSFQKRDDFRQSEDNERRKNNLENRKKESFSKKPVENRNIKPVDSNVLGSKREIENFKKGNEKGEVRQSPQHLPQKKRPVSAPLRSEVTPQKEFVVEKERTKPPAVQKAHQQQLVSKTPPAVVPVTPRVPALEPQSPSTPPQQTSISAPKLVSESVKQKEEYTQPVQPAPQESQQASASVTEEDRVLKEQPVLQSSVTSAVQKDRQQQSVSEPAAAPATPQAPVLQQQASSTLPQSVTTTEVQKVNPEINQTYLNRIKEIKNAINSKVGNPVNLIDIDNVAGREYMNALLEAMKKVNGGLAGEIDIAMQRLEESFAVVKKLIDDRDKVSTEEVGDVSKKTERIEEDTKLTASTTDSYQLRTQEPVIQTYSQAPVVAPQVQPRPEQTGPLAQGLPKANEETGQNFNVQVTRRNTGNHPQKTKIDAGVIGVPIERQELKPSQVAAPASQAPTSTEASIQQPKPVTLSPQPSTTPPQSPPSITEPVMSTPPTTIPPESEKVIAPPEKRPVISADPMRKVDLGGEVQIKEAEGAVSGFENNADLISAALEEGDISGFSSAPDLTLGQTSGTSAEDGEDLSAPSSVLAGSAGFLDKISPISAEKKVLTIDDVPETNVVSEDDLARPLYSPEIDQGLEQLLSDWSLFKKSGLFGTGPKGREHPLFKKIAGLQIPLILAGRFDGVTQEIRQSITDYMNGWRYEQGIVYEQGETFEIYLRRVIKHIIDLQKRRRGK